LGVGTVLEGSVRRMGNRVRVNVQLINAVTDQHIWSEIYDRDLTDVFAIQSELAREIASALQMQLSPGEKERLERRPTASGEAYLLYMQAHNIFTQRDRAHEQLATAEQLYYRALQLDPNFALAYANQSRLQSWLYHGKDPSPERIAKARAAASEALRLQPDLPEGRLALGYCYYYGDRDYERALAEFAIAQRRLPNDAEVFLAIGAIQRRQGKWTESTANFERASTLNPKDALLWQNLAINYSAMRRYEDAVRALERGIAAAPDAYPLQIARARLDVDFKGDATRLREFLANPPPPLRGTTDYAVQRAMLTAKTGDYPGALKLLRDVPDDRLHKKGEGSYPKAFLLGAVYRALGDVENARAQFENARRELEALVQQRPDRPGEHAKLGVTYAELGMAEEAIREGRRAMELLPESRDALDGPMYTINMAHIYTALGRNDEALALIERLLTIPAGLMPHELKTDPAWAPLRNDPRFQALISRHGV
jgi:tetratricopeptide (TPR) repeat protein